MYIKDIISKKLNRKELTEEEINFFIDAFYKDEIKEIQAASLITAMNIYGLSDKEMMYMSNAMAKTGEELEFYRISHLLTDITSIGGISDKIIIMLICILNALEYPATKVIGREMGMEDRLISMPSFKLYEDIDEFKLVLNNKGMAILKSIRNLAPVENKIYELKREIGCDHNTQLLAVSIMSQKIALGFNNIFFEITYGENAYVKTLADAKSLASYLVSIGLNLGKKVTCCVTKLNQPIGKAFGNLLELKEIYDSFNGEMSDDVKELLLEFGSRILQISTKQKDINLNKRIIQEIISNGSALESFNLLVGKDIEKLKNPVKAKNVIPVTSAQAGFIEEIDVNKLRVLAIDMNAIRISNIDKIDIGAGIVFHKKIGDEINKNTIIASIYTNSDKNLKEYAQRVQDMIQVSPKGKKKQPEVVFKI